MGYKSVLTTQILLCVCVCVEILQHESDGTQSLITHMTVQTDEFGHQMRS